MKTYARVRRNHGSWLTPLLEAHARSLDGDVVSNLIDLAEASKVGELISLDIPGPVRGYAVVRTAAYAPLARVQLYWRESEGDAGVRAILSAVRTSLGAGDIVIPEAELSPHVLDAIDVLGGLYGISALRSEELAEPTPVAPAPAAAPEARSRSYEFMRRAELEMVAKERGIFIPKKIADLRDSLRLSDES